MDALIGQSGRARGLGARVLAAALTAVLLAGIAAPAVFAADFGVTINQAPGQDDPTNGSTVEFVVEFATPVADFADGDVTLSGSAGATTATVTEIAPNDGTTYSVSVGGFASDGTVSASIPAGSATDGADSNLASTSFDDSVTVDTAAPADPTRPDMTAGTDTGSSSSDELTKDATPAFTGSAEPGALVELWVDGSGTGMTDAASGGGTWTITAPTLAEGPHTISAKATDEAGNTSGKSLTLPVVVDLTAPTTPSTPDLDAASDSGTLSTDDLTNDTTPTMTGDGAEPGGTVTLLDGSTPAGSALANGSGGWSIDSSTLAEGGHTLSARSTDAAGNDSSDSAGLAITVDVTGPSVSVTSGVADPTNANPIPITVTFGESVADFDVGDVTVGNGTPSSFSGSGTSYSFDIAPAADGAVTAGVGFGTASDSAGNPNSASNSFSTTSDGSYPSVGSIVRAEPSPTGASTVQFSVTFDEDVSGVDATDFALTTSGVSGASVTGVTGSGDGYTVTVATGTGNGTIRLDLTDDDSISDLAGNPLGGPAPDNGSFTGGTSYTIDKDLPSVESIVRVDPDPSNAAAVDFTVTFSRAVAGVDVGDFALTTGGTIAGASVSGVSGSATSWTVTVSTGSGDGPIRLDLVDDDSISDTVAGNLLGGPGAGNGGFTAGESYTVDKAGPTVILSSVTASPTNDDPIGVTVTFAEAVSGFTSADVTSGNASIVNFSGSGATYSFDLVPAGQGTVSASVAAGSALDDAGNANAASNDFSRTFDSVAPATPAAPDLDASSDTGTSTTDDLTNDPTPTFSGTAEPDSTVELLVDGSPIGDTAVATGGTWTITLTAPLSDGSPSVSARATDAAGNTSTVSGALAVTIDTAATTPAAPDLDAASDSGSSTSDDTTSVQTPTFTGSGVEPGATVTLVDGSTAVGSTAADGTGAWSVSASSLADGPHSMHVRQLDAAGNTSSDSVALALTVDTAAPGAPTTPDVATASDSGVDTGDDLTNISTPQIEGTSLEPDGTTVELREGSSVLGSTTVSSGTWTVLSSALVEGSHSITARAVDAAGNTSADSDALAMTVDTTSPTVTIDAQAGQADPTGASPVLFTVVFSEDVTGFDAGDVTDVGTGTPAGSTSASVIPVSGTTYTVSMTVSPLTYVGSVDPTVDAGGATDGAGNPNSASTSTDNHVDFNNSSPNAVDDDLTVDEDASATAVDVAGNDTDADLDTIVVTGVSDPPHGTATVVGSQVEYAPDADYNGPDSFTYDVDDGRGGLDTATVNVTVDSVNDPVIAIPDSITAVEGQAAVAYDVLANDSTAPDTGETLSITAISSPAGHGTAAVAGSQVTYTPAAGYTGADSFGYTVSDGSGSTAVASVTVSVTADTFKPVVTNPLPVILTGTMGTSTTSVRAGWQNSDVGTGVKSAFVQPLSSSAAFSLTGAGCTTPTAPASGVPASSVTPAGVRLDGLTVQAAAPPITSQTFALRVGWHHAFRNGAYDQKNNLSDLKCSKVFRLIKYEQTTSALKYTGTWSTRSVSGASGSSTKFASGAGATATLTTTGRAIAWVTYMGKTSGSAQVYVDGVLTSTINLYSTSTRVRRIAFQASWPTQGTHVIKIRLLGTTNHPRVDVDAFLIIRDN